MTNDEPQLCDCGELLKLSLDRRWPINFDEEADEVRIFTVDPEEKSRGFLRMTYCPFCGAKLPERPRESLSDDLLESVESLEADLDQLDSIADVKSFFGEPVRSVETVRKKGERQREIRQLVYDYEALEVWLTIENGEEWSISYSPGDS